MQPDTSHGAQRIFKVCLCGCESVGKTSIINQFVTGQFSTSLSPTIAAGYVNVQEIVGDHKISLNIWDTAGQERYQSMAPLYTRNAHAIIVVFDVTNTHSYQFLQNWYSTFFQEISPSPLFIVCANKSDLQPEVNLNDVTEYANTHKFPFYYTSASNGSGIREMFNDVAYRLDAQFTKQERLSVPALAEANTKSSSCC